MKTLFTFLILLSGNNVFAADHTWLFRCGSHPSYYDVAIKNGETVAGKLFIGFVPTPTKYSPAKIKAKSKGDVCTLTVSDKSGVTKISYDMEKGFESAEVTGLELNHVDADKIGCTTSEENLKSLSECKIPTGGNAKDDKKEEDGLTKLDLYDCGFKGQQKDVKATDYSISVNPRRSNGQVCLAKVACKWKGSPPIRKDDNWPSRFETFVACLPDEANNCTKSFKDCAEDKNLRFIDQEEAEKKIRSDLDIKSRGNQ